MIALSVHSASGGAIRVKPCAAGGELQPLAQVEVRRHAAGDDQRAAGRLLCRAADASRAPSGRPARRRPRPGSRRTGRPWWRARPRPWPRSRIRWRTAVFRPGEGEVAGLGALQRARQVEPRRVAARAPAAPPPGRPGSRGPASSRPCRTPRRASRRWWCRAGGSGRRPRPRRAGNGRRRPAAGGRGSRASATKRAVSACASRWLTATSGRPCTRAMRLAGEQAHHQPADQARARRWRRRRRGRRSRARPRASPGPPAGRASRHGRGLLSPAPRRHRARARRAGRTAGADSTRRSARTSATAVSSQLVSIPSTMASSRNPPSPGPEGRCLADPSGNQP